MPVQNPYGNTISDAQLREWFGSGRSPAEVASAAATLGMTPDQLAGAINTGMGTNLSGGNVREYLGANDNLGYNVDPIYGRIQRTPTAADSALNTTSGFTMPFVNALNSYITNSAPAPTLSTPQAFNFQADPGYAFRQQEGERALSRGQAARGGFFSGRAMRELNDFNSGLASQEYGNAYNRYLQGNADTRATEQQQFDQWGNQLDRRIGLGLTGYQLGSGLENTLYNRAIYGDNTDWTRLTQLSGSGQTAANTTSGAATNYGNAGSGAYNNIGNANASGAINTANAWTGAGNNALAYYAYMNAPWRNQPTRTP